MEYALRLVDHFDESRSWKAYLSKVSVLQNFYDVPLSKLGEIAERV